VPYLEEVQFILWMYMYNTCAISVLALVQILSQMCVLYSVHVFLYTVSRQWC